MMKKVLINMTIVLISLFIGSSFAARKNNSIRIKQYFNATCEDYKGTWSGFATDPSDLFQDGGPWPILVHLLPNVDGKVVGRTTAIKGVVNEKEIWANCKNGVLKHIFWGAKGSCGSFSQEGLLVSKNVLMLKLHYESAMNSADFLLLLSRKSNSYPYSAPKNKEDFELGKVESCH